MCCEACPLFVLPGTCRLPPDRVRVMTGIGWRGVLDQPLLDRTCTAYTPYPEYSIYEHVMKPLEGCAKALYSFWSTHVPSVPSVPR
jgi:hypothetical protein